MTKAEAPRPDGDDSPENQSGGRVAPAPHPFAKWMRPSTNAGKARRNWEEAEDEHHWLQLLREAEARREDAPPASYFPPELTAPPAPGDGPDPHLFREQGWAMRGPLLSSGEVKRLAFLGDTVRNAGWPRVFAYLYEDTWQILRAASLHETLRDWLGKGHRQLPGLWFHHVAAVAGARGWGPHVDSPRTATFDPEGRPDRLTIWMPLVDVDATRACIFLVPPQENAADLPQRVLQDAHIPMDMMLRLMHVSQPVPCKAGSLVAWRPDVLHWGGIHHGLGGPRGALSLEFIRAGVAREPEEELSLACDKIPDFATRLYLVARGLLAYGKSSEREPHAYSFLNWGESVYRRYQAAAMRESLRV